MHIDKKSPIPVYYQLMNIIMEKIKSGEYSVGSLIPSERDLSELLGISRMSVRQALHHLVNEGLLTREKGKGTFVTKMKFEQRNIMSFSEQFRNIGAEIFIPDNKNVDEAIKRTTHMAIAAHQDDIEIMALDGILKCFGREENWFFGVVVTDGAGSPRNDLYVDYSDQDMQKVRKMEQKKAAYIGEYGAMALLNYTSSEVKSSDNEDLANELMEIIEKANPKVIYTHNLADKHDTHVGVVLKVIKAIRKLPENIRPEKLYACEVWRNLDWVNDDEKVLFDVSGHSNIASALVEVFDSQICGGKRYDLATAGRKLANATYSASHGTDSAKSLIYGMDLTPLINDLNIDINEFIQNYIKRFAEDVSERINKIK